MYYCLDGSEFNVTAPQAGARLSLKTDAAKNLLLNSMFKPTGPSVTPSMFNNQNPYSGLSPYGQYYKAK